MSLNIMRKKYIYIFGTKKQINYSENNRYHRLVGTWITYLKWEQIKILLTTREKKNNMIIYI